MDWVWRITPFTPFNLLSLPISLLPPTSLSFLPTRPYFPPFLHSPLHLKFSPLPLPSISLVLYPLYLSLTHKLSTFPSLPTSSYLPLPPTPSLLPLPRVRAADLQNLRESQLLCA